MVLRCEQLKKITGQRAAAHSADQDLVDASSEAPNALRRCRADAEVVWQAERSGHHAARVTCESS
jgi:hypothetical protein